MSTPPAQWFRRIRNGVCTPAAGRFVWMLVGVIGCLFVTAELISSGKGHASTSQTQAQAPVEPQPTSPASPLTLTESGDIVVEPGTRLSKKLAIGTLAKERVSIPVLTVTGTIVARLSEISPSIERNWHFNDPELRQIYVDLLQSRTEVAFSEKQLDKIKELSAASVKSHNAIVVRLKKLVAGGTDAPKDLASAETELAHAELQGQKETFDAEATLQKALTNRGSLRRKLAQSGIDEEVLDDAKVGTVIVVAEVPEARIADVHEDTACSAQFYGFPGKSFPGHVGRPAPVLSAEGRTLRVPFELPDAERRLRPGMYAEVALGTDERDALFAPADGLLHIAAADYLIFETSPNTWRAQPVHAGEPIGGRIEILSGGEAGRRVMGNGAILLKPLVVQSLARTTTGSSVTGTK